MSGNPFAFLGASSYLGALQRLLPTGPAWPREAGSVQTGYVAAHADLFADLQARASALSEVESDPAQTLELLPEWEADYGLPDPCAGISPQIEVRRAQLLARIAATGGQSIAYYIGFAALLGFTITITENKPARADQLVADGPVNDPLWAFVWTVHAPATTEIDFRADLSAADEPLVTRGNAVLQCELQRLAPAHTKLLFAYGS